jgi:hypothetical protein
MGAERAKGHIRVDRKDFGPLAGAEMIVRRLSSPAFTAQSHLGRLGPDALEFGLLEIVFFGNGLDKTRGSAVEVFGDFSEKRHLIGSG